MQRTQFFFLCPSHIIRIKCIIAYAQGLTIDSLIPEGAPPRVIQGEIVSDINAYYAKHYPEHLARANSRVIPVPPGVYIESLDEEL